MLLFSKKTLIYPLLCIYSSVHAIPTISSLGTVSGTPTSTPSLTRTAIGFSEPTAGQAEFFLSSDLKKELQDTLHNECKAVTPDICAIYMHSDLINSNIITEGHLKSRTLDSDDYRSAFIAAGVAWKLSSESQKFDNYEIPDYYKMDMKPILDIPDLDAVAIKAEKVEAVLNAKPTETGSVPSGRYVVIPTASPKLSDRVPDIQARQAERQAFEGRASKAGVKLNRVLTDKNIAFWTADLDRAQLVALKNDPIIEHVIPNASVDTMNDLEEEVPQSETQIRSHRRRYTNAAGRSFLSAKDKENQITRRVTGKDKWDVQHNAPMELHTLSDLNARPGAVGDYDFVKTAGQDSIIYVVEQDPFRITHPEIGRASTSADVDGWIHPNPGTSKPPPLFPSTIDPGAGHATKVLSKIIGKTVGVAKKAHVVCVQVRGTQMSDVYHFWTTILQDAVQRKLVTRRNIIINYSQGVSPKFPDFVTWRRPMRKVFQYFTDAGIVVVLAAGNDPTLQKLDRNAKVQLETEVALSNPNLKILMAGHADSTGVSRINPIRYAKVWAVAVDASVADPATGRIVEATGSSYAAPQIAGLVATFLEDPKMEYYWNGATSIPDNAERLVRRTSAKRDSQVAGQKQPLAYNLAHDDVCNIRPTRRDANLRASRRDTPREAPKCIDLGGTGPITVPTSTSPKLPVITNGSGSGKCGSGKRVGTVGIKSKPIDKGVLQKCLLNLDTSKWLDDGIGQAYDCGGLVSFQSASKSWDSPAHCHNSCKNCLSQSIEDGVNQVWCDAWAGSAHCWEGYIITPPPLVKDGSPFPDPTVGGDNSLSQNIKTYDYKGINGKYIDQYAVQDCIRKIDGKNWMVDDKAYNCGGMLHFDLQSMSSVFPWNSPSDCWNAVKNCLSDAVNKGASEASCSKSAGATTCRGSFYPR